VTGQGGGSMVGINHLHDRRFDMWSSIGEEKRRSWAPLMEGKWRRRDAHCGGVRHINASWGCKRKKMT
jgi:hypothetical protein